MPHPRDRTLQRDNPHLMQRSMIESAADVGRLQSHKPPSLRCQAQIALSGTSGGCVHGFFSDDRLFAIDGGAKGR